MLVAYNRYKPSSASDANFDEVCTLLRSTGYIPNGRRPPNYPDDFFRRIPVPPLFVDMVIARLRTDDIYNRIAAYPVPQHRSAALATQASMLYVILYFQPETLHKQPARMREIVDKHFPDNWVIAHYMGIVVNLVEAWEPYRAARLALMNTIGLANIRTVATGYVTSVKRLHQDVAKYLEEGVLVEEYVLIHISQLMHCMRECNVTLRWLMLHTCDSTLYDKQHAECKHTRDAVLQCQFNARDLFGLLLNTAQYEFLLQKLFNELLAQKQAKWEALKKEGVERMMELSDVFSGERPLARVERNENLQNWFRGIAREIELLNYNDSTAAGRKIVQLTQALEMVQSYHQLETNMQICQFLMDSRGFLTNMLRIINIKEEVVVQIQLVADLSYAWEIIRDYTAYMQDSIKEDPAIVKKLRATFLKLVSTLEMPLLRIKQADSGDFDSVSQFYSGQLVAYVRGVLQIIPQSMFKVLREIIGLQTRQIKELPSRVEKEHMKDYAALEHRYVVARRTHDISIFTDGILALQTTLVGVVKVDPKRLLEDGIRKELVQHVAVAMDELLVFNPKVKGDDLMSRLAQLQVRMEGLRRSFEYIQDYLNIYGLKIWQEEVSRIVNYNVEQECNRFLKTKVYDWQSVYQSTAIPIPRFPPRDAESANFIGRVAREILRVTDPHTSIFIDAMNVWYDARSSAEIMDARAFLQLERALGSFGLAGFDRLLSFMITTGLQQFSASLLRRNRADAGLRQALQDVDGVLAGGDGVPDAAMKAYTQLCGALSKILAPLVDIIVRLGQMQIIRRFIARQLHTSCIVDSKLLFHSLQVFNEAVLNDMCEHYRDPTKPYPSPDNLLLQELSLYLSNIGLSDPFHQIYFTPLRLENIALFLFGFVIALLPRYELNANVGSCGGGGARASCCGTRGRRRPASAACGPRD